MFGIDFIAWLAIVALLTTAYWLRSETESEPTPDPIKWEE
jgi:hypothetical protein